MTLLDQVEQGVTDKPRRVEIYGTHGVGRTELHLEFARSEEPERNSAARAR